MQQFVTERVKHIAYWLTCICFLTVTPYHNFIVSPMDYCALSEILVFATCGRQQCVNVTIVDDLEVEMNENFLYTLERAPGLNFEIKLNPVEGEILIVDNDCKWSYYADI